MVSVLVPVYNSCAFLEKCIQSIISQSYQDLQIVFIDDGSTDDSWDILKEFALKDNRIEIYKQQNRGVSATRNSLLAKAKGDFVLWVDSDDWIDNNTVELLLLEQEKEDFDVVVFQIYGWPDELTGYFSRELIVPLFLEHKSITGSLCNKLIKRAFFDGMKFDESVYFGEDALMVWQILQHISNVCVIKDQLYHYRKNINSLSRQHFNGKKFTAYTVWNAICEDVAEEWPQFIDIAKARFACEMTLILRNAVRARYKRDLGVRLLQEEVRRDGHLIYKTGVSTEQMRLFAWLVSHSYWLATKLSPYIKN